MLVAISTVESMVLSKEPLCHQKEILKVTCIEDNNNNGTSHKKHSKRMLFPTMYSVHYFIKVELSELNYTQSKYINVNLPCCIFMMA